MNIGNIGLMDKGLLNRMFGSNDRDIAELLSANRNLAGTGKRKGLDLTPEHLKELFKTDHPVDFLKKMTYSHLSSRTTLKTGLNIPGQIADNGGALNSRGAFNNTKAAGVGSKATVTEMAAAERAAAAISSGGSSGNISVEMSLDLFWSLSSRITRESGVHMADKFHRTTADVVERFNADFNMKIEITGDYLGNTERVVEFNPELLDDFLNAMNGLVNMDKVSKEEFLAASDKFFDDLATRYSEAEDIFREAGAALEKQVRSFFGNVENAMLRLT